MKTKLISLILCLLLCVIPVSAQDEDILVLCDDEPVTFIDQRPVIVEGRTLIPVRAAATAMGVQIFWHDEEKKLIISGSDQIVVMRVGDPIVNIMYTNIDKGMGGGITLDVPPQIINGRATVPVRAIAQLFGCVVYWDSAVRTIRLYTKNYEPHNTINNADEIKSLWRSVKTDFLTIAPDNEISLAGYFTTTSPKVNAAFKVFDAPTLIKEGLKTDCRGIKWYCMYRALDYVGTDRENEFMQAVSACETSEDDVALLSAKGFCLALFNEKFDHFRFLHTSKGIVYSKYYESKLKDKYLYIINDNKPKKLLSCEQSIQALKLSPSEKMIAVGSGASEKMTNLVLIDVQTEMNVDIVPYIKKWLENLKETEIHSLYITSFGWEDNYIMAECCVNGAALSGKIKYNVAKGDMIFVEYSG